MPRCRTSTTATGWHNPIPIKKACELIGLCGPRLRLPLVEADDERTAIVARGTRGARGADCGVSGSSLLRVLPLGGLGEIGKNMTVVESTAGLLIVDVGLRFPTAEMMGIDLVLPDFSYLREPCRRHRGHRHHARPRRPSRRAAVRAA